MQFEWLMGPMSEWRADAIVFFAFEKSGETLPGLRRYAETEAPWLVETLKLGDFDGKADRTAVFYAPGGSAVPRVILAGLGPIEKFDVSKLRSASAWAMRKCRELHLVQPGFPLAAFEGLFEDPAEVLEETLIGALCGLHRFDAFKTREYDASEHPETLLIMTEERPGEALFEAPSRATAIASGMSLARDLTAAPANRVTPTYMAEAARRVAETYGLRCEVIPFESALEQGMGAFSAVAKGSREPACVIILEHAPEGTADDAPIVLIGKGITFDTGGISLKQAAKLDQMKEDMAGAAAVLGALEIAGRLGISKRVIGILPCTENMPGGKAYKPGDIIRSLSGFNIEISNTDAEGRLVLCDAITYALRYQPAAIIDIATLTGACVVALGAHAAGVMGNREGLVRSIRAVGERVGERLWPLPLWDAYFENIKSDVADFKNTGGREGGASAAGVFLKQFVPDNIPWVHLDIAGTAWAEKDTGVTPKGATGFGVRIMAEVVERWPDLPEK